MPKIAIDISPLYNGNSVRGVGYYTTQLLASIQKEVAVNPDFSDYQIELVTDTKSIKKGSYDLIHYPYFDHFHLTLPLNFHTPYIISLHDLVPIEYQKYFPVGIKGTIKWQIQKFLAKKAKLLITITHHSKYIISDILKYPQDKIYVTYLAADERFRPRHGKQIEDLKARYKLPDEFILYMGDLNWNKNIPTLVNACLKNNYPLVIGGSAAVKPAPLHPWTKDIRWLQDKIKEINTTHPGLIITPGFIPDQDLPLFFNAAKIYCQPSFAEGFGLGITQAMQSGCPVVGSDRGAVAEIINHHGQLFNPESVESLVQALQKVWTQDQLRSSLVKAGLDRVKEFNWQYTAIQTLSVYRAALLHEK